MGYIELGRCGVSPCNVCSRASLSTQSLQPEMRSTNHGQPKPSMPRPLDLQRQQLSSSHSHRKQTYPRFDGWHRRQPWGMEGCIPPEKITVGMAILPSPQYGWLTVCQSRPMHFLFFLHKRSVLHPFPK